MRLIIRDRDNQIRDAIEMLYSQSMPDYRLQHVLSCRPSYTNCMSGVIRCFDIVEVVLIYIVFPIF